MLKRSGTQAGGHVCTSWSVLELCDILLPRAMQFCCVYGCTVQLGEATGLCAFCCALECLIVQGDLNEVYHGIDCGENRRCKCSFRLGLCLCHGFAVGKECVAACMPQLMLVLVISRVLMRASTTRLCSEKLMVIVSR